MKNLKSRLEKKVVSPPPKISQKKIDFKGDYSEEISLNIKIKKSTIAPGLINDQGQISGPNDINDNS